MAFSLTYSTYDLDGPILLALDSTGEATNSHPTGYTVRNVDGREFMYIHFDSSGVAAVAGAPCVWQQSTTNNVVTSDVSDTNQGSVAGAFLSILANNTASTACYGWIQTEGLLVNAPSSGTQAVVTTGDPLTANDGLWKTTAEGTLEIGATAMEAGTAGEGDIRLHGRP